MSSCGHRSISQIGCSCDIRTLQVMIMPVLIIYKINQMRTWAIITTPVRVVSLVFGAAADSG